MGRIYTRGGNRSGAKWNKGGSKSRKNYINVDFSNFARYAEELDRLNADLKDVFTEAMEDAGKTVQEDVTAAVSAANLPAGGKYSTGETADSVIRDPKVQWSGTLGEMGLGFDKTKPGAGGFLTTGTPKMPPDLALQDIFQKKSYATKIKKQIEQKLQARIDRLGG